MPCAGIHPLLEQVPSCAKRDSGVISINSNSMSTTSSVWLCRHAISFVLLFTGKNHVCFVAICHTFLLAPFVSAMRSPGSPGNQWAVWNIVFYLRQIFACSFWLFHQKLLQKQVKTLTSFLKIVFYKKNLKAKVEVEIRNLSHVWCHSEGLWGLQSTFLTCNSWFLPA